MVGEQSQFAVLLDPEEKEDFLRRGISGYFVRIGRTLQSFPPSKRSVRLSPHSAFQLGLWTQEERIRRCRPRGAPVAKDRHLLSPLHPFASLLTGFPWRTFTLSGPLQPGIWLLRRLRPLGHPLAFSRPARAGKADQSSPVPPPVPLSTRSCLLDAGRTSEQLAADVGAAALAAIPFWARCLNHFHLVYLTTRQTQISPVSLGCKISPIIRLWLTEVGTLSAGFAPRRVPLVDARRLIFMPLLRHDQSMANTDAVKGRTQHRYVKFHSFSRKW